MVCQIHDMANERPNRLGGFSTGSTKLTFMLYCGYFQAENREAIELIVDKGISFHHNFFFFEILQSFENV